MFKVWVLLENKRPFKVFDDLQEAVAIQGLYAEEFNDVEYKLEMIDMMNNHIDPTLHVELDGGEIIEKVQED